MAVLEYRMGRGNRIALTHTGVPKEMEGKGIASALARTALDYARANGLKVLPLCAFVQTYLKRHPEFMDLVATYQP